MSRLPARSTTTSRCNPEPADPRPLGEAGLAAGADGDVRAAWLLGPPLPCQRQVDVPVGDSSMAQVPPGEAGTGGAAAVCSLTALRSHSRASERSMVPPDAPICASGAPVWTRQAAHPHRGRSRRPSRPPRDHASRWSRLKTAQPAAEFLRRSEPTGGSDRSGHQCRPRMSLFRPSRRIAASHAATWRRWKPRRRLDGRAARRRDLRRQPQAPSLNSDEFRRTMHPHAIADQRQSLPLEERCLRQGDFAPMARRADGSQQDRAYLTPAESVPPRGRRHFKCGTIARALHALHS